MFNFVNHFDRGCATDSIFFSQKNENETLEHCKNILINDSKLHFPNFSKLSTKALNSAIEVVLSQGNLRTSRPIHQSNAKSQ